MVADGLIHFYLESRAADYIASLSNESNYAESPYLAYSAKKKRLQLSQKSVTSKKSDQIDSNSIKSNASNGLKTPEVHCINFYCIITPEIHTEKLKRVI